MKWLKVVGGGALARVGSGLLAAAAAGCTMQLQPMGPVQTVPVFNEHTFVTADGVWLPLRRWLPQGPPRAIILALHGMNDYSHAFDGPGRYWASVGLATYAYDQRGFGESSHGGVWPGTETLVADLSAAVDVLRQIYPAVPLVVLGESMGGAVLAHALASALPAVVEGAQGRPLVDRIDGAVLSAAALWGPAGLPWPARLGLWLARCTVPGWRVRPPRALRIVPSDNIEMLRDLGRDPLVRKDARVDTLGGLTDLMAAAEAGIGAWPRDLPMLVLYGQHEQVLPAPAVRQALASIKAHHANSAMHVRVYDTGYHLLLRDIGAQRVLDDVAAWVATLNSYKNTGALFTDGWTQSLPYAKRSQPI